jgi:hypothetical protein
MYFRYSITRWSTNADFCNPCDPRTCGGAQKEKNSRRAKSYGRQRSFRKTVEHQQGARFLQLSAEALDLRSLDL